MPLYEYQCDACGNRFEKIQKFSDPPPDGCPSCGGSVRKLFSSPAIQFKGSGWYITDYAKKSSSDTASGDKSDTASGDKSAPASGDKDKAAPSASGSDASSPPPAPSSSTTSKD